MKGEITITEDGNVKATVECEEASAEVVEKITDNPESSIESSENTSDKADNSNEQEEDDTFEADSVSPTEFVDKSVLKTSKELEQEVEEADGDPELVEQVESVHGPNGRKFGEVWKTSYGDFAYSTIRDMDNSFMDGHPIDIPIIKSLVEDYEEPVQRVFVHEEREFEEKDHKEKATFEIPMIDYVEGEIATSKFDDQRVTPRESAVNVIEGGYFSLVP